MLLQAMHRHLAADTKQQRPGILSDFWYTGMLPATTSGVKVTPDGVMNGQSATVFTCVRILAEAMAVLPIKTYRRTDGDNRVPATTHPAWRLLNDKPNNWQTPTEFKQFMTASRVLRGNGYAMQILDAQGNIAELRPLHPDFVKPELLENGRVRYKVWNRLKLEWMIVPQEFMMHLRSGISNDGVTGLSAIAAGRNSVGLSVAAENFASRSFKNGAVPQLAITHPEQLEDESRKRLRDEWIETHGADNQGSVAVLDEGVKLEKIGMNNDDAQLLESRKYSREEIAALFRVPLFLLNAFENGASFSSIEEVGQSFVTYTLLPMMKEWEETAQRDLITNPATFYCEMTAETYLRADFSKRMAGYNQAWWLTGNEIRRLENLPPMPQAYMDEPQMPLNRGNPGGAATQPNGSNNSPDAKAHRTAVAAVAEDAMGRAIRSEARQIARIREDGKENAGERITTFLTGKHAEFMLATLAPAGNLAERMKVDTVPVDAFVEAHIAKAVEANKVECEYPVDQMVKSLTQMFMKEE